MTHNISEHPKWSRDEFLAFLLLFAAGADMKCTDEERAMIRSGIDDAHLSRVESEYDQLSDFERISVIKAYRSQYYQDAEQKSSLLHSVEQLFNADGEYDIMERNVYLMLQKIL